MDEGLSALVAAVVGALAGWLTSVLNHRYERRARRGDDAVGSVRHALDALAVLRSTYQQAALARRRKPSAAELARAENAFVSACDQSASEELAGAARGYVDVGRAYASGDPDTGATDEEAAHDAMSALMRAAVRRAQEG